MTTIFGSNWISPLHLTQINTTYEMKKLKIVIQFNSRIPTNTSNGTHTHTEASDSSVFQRWTGTVKWVWPASTQLLNNETGIARRCSEISFLCSLLICFSWCLHYLTPLVFEPNSLLWICLCYTPWSVWHKWFFVISKTYRQNKWNFCL